MSHVPIPPRWQCANGLTENLMKPLLRCIQTAHVERKSWKHALTSFLLNYRAIPHVTTGVAPGEMLFGRQIHTNLPHFTCKTDVQNIEKFAQAKDEQSNEKNKVLTDLKTNAKFSVIKIGDQVLLLQEKPNKLTTHFNPYPFIVVNRKGCLVTLERNGKFIKQNVAHCKRVSKNQNFTVPRKDEDIMGDLANTPDCQTGGQTQRYPTRIRKPPSFLSPRV